MSPLVIRLKLEQIVIMRKLISVRLKLACSLAILPMASQSFAATDDGGSDPAVSTIAGTILTIEGKRFRDLDHDGKLAPYEDWRLSPAARTADLVSRMTIEEKVGTMMHSTLASVGGILGDTPGGYDFASAGHEIDGLKITSFITRLPVSPQEMALQNNKVQEIAERTRLGIPVTISTDPMHHFQEMLGATSAGGGYSQWPELLGFGALRSPNLVKRFAEIARRDYRAIGIHMALSPQADLFTEPRWARGAGTFGSDPKIARDLVAAYVEGFQGSPSGLSRNGVLTVVKHWVGYGATPEGWDGHNYYGRYAKVDAKSLDLHIEPFKGAFQAHVAGVMPTYSIVQGATVNGKPVEQVAAGFNRQLLTELLRGTYGFNGIILSDWAITNDCTKACSDPEEMQPDSAIAMPWGVEKLSPLDRYVKGIDAGIDQFGGVNRVDMVLDAVQRGLVDEARIDESVRRVLISKFEIGIFENPFVDPEMAGRIVNSPAAQAEAKRAQAESQVLLKNKGRLLPLRIGTKVWLHGINPDRAAAFNLSVVARPEDADVAIVRTATPFERLHPNHFFGSIQNEGRLDYRPGNPDFDLVAGLEGKAPVVMAAFTDRPAVMTQIAPLVDAILINFGVSDDALLAVVTGKEKARGRLPFELPTSMDTVVRQDPAYPDDSDAPLFPAGAGLKK